MSDGQSTITVVGASVVVKVVVEEEHSVQADALYAQSLREPRPLVAPALLLNEVTNAIYRQLRRGLLTNDKAQRSLERFFAMSFALVAPSDPPRRAFAFARAHNLPSIYDSLYVVLAHDLSAELWTADQRLLNALGGAAPWVRWIGDYPTA